MEELQVFLSWSGDRSKAVATALNDWIPNVIQSANPWISTGMERGVAWAEQIAQKLGDHSFGIVCVTPENWNSPWLNFEAGALAKRLGGEVRMIPFALGYDDLLQLQQPLGGFNASLADHDHTFRMMETLNKHAPSPLSEDRLRRSFEAYWDELEKKLSEIAALEPTQPTKRDPDSKLDEVLDLVRQIDKRTRRGQPLSTTTSVLNLLRAAEFGGNSQWQTDEIARITAEDAQSDPKRELVPLLLKGVTDSAIAAALGVPERSVRRWIADLMDELDVRTRLQLGAALARSYSVDGQPGVVTDVPAPHFTESPADDPLRPTEST